MQTFDLTLGVVMVASSLGTALLALLIMGYFQPPRRISWTPVEDMDEAVVFLLRDREVVDSTRDAQAMLDSGPGFLDDWGRIAAIAERRFPEFCDEILALADRQKILLEEEGTGYQIEAEWRNGLARIIFREGPERGHTGDGDHFSRAALTEELATLRSVVDDAPILVWKEDGCGAVRWANGAYVDLVNRVVADEDSVGWPLPRVFPDRPIGMDPSEPPRRLSVSIQGEEEPIWFDTYDESQGEDTLVFALPADKLVRAEASLREFVQTLTKTFAHLPTGLAVFDRERRLALFNPALMDLSSLEPQFLSARPGLFEFLDKLREKQRMPEPKDYKTWRQQILAMETAASSGTHQEVWSLPSGQTYRVTGRPHPNGAIAFLFEDISAEISLTRTFRAEIELNQSVFDCLDDAIAVFSSGGQLIMSNKAYSDLWNSSNGSGTSILDAIGVWKDFCEPSPVWGDLRDFVGDTGERAEWTGDLRLKSGRKLYARFTPASGHSTIVNFSLREEARPFSTKVWANIPAKAG
ncbi:PAS domain-containing protein [Aliiruegeria haliotis]|uniref:PAS domain-containing protein n=1 Tax=Aliiruegeria haliotis TaxID=1280846 RepID=A0A2T0RHW2_9RHOB|nr:PAS-domain containing protein [Aliiruegeria haliotis]PRY20711.1 PAS domain-containing protein [Aliiruegeria haliotis]